MRCQFHKCKSGRNKRRWFLIVLEPAKPRRPLGKQDYVAMQTEAHVMLSATRHYEAPKPLEGVCRLVVDTAQQRGPAGHSDVGDESHREVCRSREGMCPRIYPAVATNRAHI